MPSGRADDGLPRFVWAPAGWPVIGPHKLLNPASMAPATGFSHAVVAAAGRLVFLGGQAAHDADGTIVGDSIADQFGRAAANVVAALEAAGGTPSDLVQMLIYVTDLAAYRASLTEIGAAYRKHFGRHYPAIALLEVTGLFDEEARVELVCTAVIPD